MDRSSRISLLFQTTILINVSILDDECESRHIITNSYTNSDSSGCYYSGIIFPIIPVSVNPNLEHIIPAILNPTYPIYYIILGLGFIQTALVFKYLLYVPMKEYYGYSYSPKNFLNSFIHPFSYYSQYYSYYYSPKRYFKSGGYEKPVVKYELIKKTLYAEISLFIIFIIIYYTGIYYICPLVVSKNQNCMSPALLKEEC